MRGRDENLKKKKKNMKEGIVRLIKLRYVNCESNYRSLS